MIPMPDQHDCVGRDIEGSEQLAAGGIEFEQGLGEVAQTQRRVPSAAYASAAWVSLEAVNACQFELRDQRTWNPLFSRLMRSRLQAPLYEGHGKPLSRPWAGGAGSRVLWNRD